MLSLTGRRESTLFALALFAVVAAAIVIGARHGQQREEAEVRLHAAITSEQMAARLETYIATRLRVVEHLSQGSFVRALGSEEAFREDALGLQDQFSGFQAINWIDRTGVIRWVVPEGPNLAAKNKDLHTHPGAADTFARVEQTKQIGITPPLELFQGGTGFATYVPVLHDGEVTGYLNGVFRIKPLVEGCLQGNARAHFTIEVRDGDTVVFTDGPPPPPARKRFTASSNLHVLDRTWSIALTPTPTLMSTAFTWVDEAWMVLGVLLAAGLAGVVFLLAERQAQLTASEARYESIVDDLRFGVLIHRGGTPLFANEALATITGYPREAMDRLPVLDVVAPEYREMVATNTQARIAGKPAPPFFEIEILHRDGTRRWVEIGASRISYQGQPAALATVLDITARREAEAALREGEARYHGMFDQAAVGITIVDAAGEYLEVNDRFLEMLGYTRETFAGKTVRDTHHPDDPESTLPYAQQLTSGEKSVVVWEARRVCANGDTVWCRGTMSLLRNADNDPFAFLTVLEDISAWRRAEEALRDSEERYRLLAHHAHDMIWAMDATGTFTYVSPAAERMFGYDPEELIGQDAMNVSSPQGKALFAEAQSGAAHKARYESEFTTKDGRVIPTEVTAVTIRDADGALVAVQGVTRDISDRKAAEASLRESEERYRLLADQASDIIWATDAGAVFIYISPAVERMLGYTPEELVGKPLSRLLSPEATTEVDRLLARAIAGVGDTARLEVPLECKTGPPIWCDIAAVIIRDESGAIIRLQGVARDVTERKRVQDALRESEQRFRLLANTAPVGIFHTNARGRALYTNPAFEELTGVTAEQMNLADGWDETLAPDVRARALGRWATALATQQGYGTEERLRRPDGTEVWLYARIEPIREADGTFAGFIGTVVDVTERKRREQELAQRAESERVLAEVAGRFINVSEEDLDAAITAALETTGRFAGAYGTGVMLLDEAEEHFVLTHRWVTDGAPPLFPMGQHFPCAALPWFVAQLRAGQVVQVTTPADLPPDATQERAFLERTGLAPIALVPLAGAGQLRGYISLTVKNTEREWTSDTLALLRFIGDLVVNALDRQEADHALRRSEERFRTLVEQSPLPTAIFGLDGKPVLVNPATVATWCIDLERAPVLLDTYNIFEDPQIAQNGLMPYIHRAFAGEAVELPETYYDPEQTPATSNAGMQPRWIRANMYPVRGMSGDIVEVVLVQVDVTKQREAEQDRERLTAQLQQAQKMEAVGTLAGGIAHDFNNLLTGILGGVQLALMDVPPDSTVATSLQQAEEAAERAAELTKQLLTLSRKQDPQMGPTEVNDVVQRTARLLQRSVSETIEIRVISDPAIPTIEGDAGQLGQALLNLGINARDAMPDGGRLTLETRLVTIDDAYVRVHPQGRLGPFVSIAIADTGGGIPPDVVQHIFEPFYTTKEQGKGTGLGLAMVYGCMQAHSGWVTVESEPGGGTAFRLYLPRVEVHAKPPTRATDDVPRGTETILLVDDTDAVLFLGRGMLERCGYRVIVAWNGEEALQKYHEAADEIAVVLTDLVMPHVGGRQLLQALRDAGADVPVILTSGYGVNGRARDMLDEGFAAFISKPFDLTTLAHTVRHVLSEHRAAASPAS